MISAHHFGKKTALSAIALLLGLNATSAAATISRPGFHAAAGSVTTVHPLTVLHNFAGPDGSAPVGNLDLDVSLTHSGVSYTLFGVTEGGGSLASGSIYTYTLGSNVFNSLYSFTGGNDGDVPAEGLANNETNYFGGGLAQLGVAIDGGLYGNGTVFSIKPNGTFTVVHSFTGGVDGGAPAGRLTQFVDGDYYGTTSSGGAHGYGTVFKISPSGTFTTIHSFTGGADGGAPQAGLTLQLSGAGNIAMNPARAHAIATSPKFVSPYLYGTTSTGAAGGVGTIFRINASGVVQTLYTFSGGLDGGVPAAKLTADYDGNFYGTTTVGGVDGNGVIFKLFTNGSTFKVIHDFGDGSLGASPQAQITLAFNGKLYGTTTSGGASGQYGTVFEVSANGTYTDLHDFASTDGANPQGALTDGGDGNLYGTTINGGVYGSGVLYKIPE
jgi:uncharacterized repeat protein (TIGR03803 family)